ncbi:MAG: DUF4350 domain-containing protein [Bacteroidia bacterium]|nr:DUF4350 domain-containing protein [Bacteroidia bacterium]
MLDKRSKRIVLVFGAVLLLLILSEVLRPRPVNWRPSYTSIDKIPFGSYVLFEELQGLFKESTIEKVTRDPYEFLLDSTYMPNSAYIFLNNSLFFDERQVDALLKYVSEGNSAFIAANNYGYILEDSLGLHLETNYQLLEESIHPDFFNSEFKMDSLPRFQRGIYKTTFNDIDTLQTTALGYFNSKEERLDELNFVAMEVGEGKLFFHSLPEAFTNYYMLNGNERYVAQVLSYLDADTIYWDSYLKSGRKVISSPMRFVLSQSQLRWFYYLTLTGLILLVLFKAKREQRVIQVVKPLENTSIEFTRTIGDLYFQHKDFTNIISKKITYFMEVVRSKYYLNTQELNDAFITKLAQKSGNDQEKTRTLIDYIKHLKTKSFHTEADLVEFNKKTQDFNL